MPDQIGVIAAARMYESAVAVVALIEHCFKQRLEWQFCDGVATRPIRPVMLPR